MNLFLKNKIVRYIISGSITSLSVFLLLYSLVQVLSIWYLTASAISFCFGIIVSFTMQKFFTFKNYSIKRIHLQFSFFIIFNIFMLGLNTLFMYIFVDIFNFWYLSSQIFITMLTAFVNYITFNKLIFRDMLYVKSN